MTDDFDQLEALIFDELLAVIGDACDKEETTLHEIQPTSAVLGAAAEAATQVLIAFEHGYHIGG